MLKSTSLLLIWATLALVAATCFLAEAKVHPPVHLPLSGRPSNHLTRRGALVEGATGPVVPLNGNLTYWAEYFATVGLGEPAQIFRLQVDTGSTDLIVYSKGCQGCPKGSLRYDFSKSKTADTVFCDDGEYRCRNAPDCNVDTCNFEDDYGGGAQIRGTVVDDRFSVGSLKAKSNNGMGQITAIENLQGFEPTGVDGIWGMAYKKLSGWDGQTMWDTLVYDYGFYDGFSLCLGQNSGTLSLGVDYSKNTQFVWTDITQELWYVVYLKDFKMNNVSLGLSPSVLNDNNVIVDSGTTLLVVDKKIFATIQARLLSMCNTAPLVGVCNIPLNQSIFNNQCFQMTNAQINQFPSITLTFDQAGDLSIDPIDYLWQGSGTAGYYCLGIAPISGVSIIIGDVFMQKYHTVFDRVSGKIGFGPTSTCPTTPPLSPA